MTEQPTPSGSTPPPVPDLGFFGSTNIPPGQATPPSQFGTAASTFGAPPVTAFGVAPSAVYPPYPAVQQRGGLPGWAIALIAVGVSLFLVMVMAAVAIPTFLDQRERARADAATTTIVLPASVEGLPRLNDPEEQARLQSLLGGFPAGAGETQGIIYSDGTSRRIVVFSARFPEPAGPADLRNLMAGFDDGLVSNAPPGVTMSEPSDREPGRLGGRIRCATMSGAASGQMCTAADSVSMLTIIDVSSGRIDPDLPRRVREAVVHRP